MNIPLEFDPEHQNALNQLRARYNAQGGLPLTESEYLAALINGIVGEEVTELFRLELSRVGEVVSGLPWEQRQAISKQFTSSEEP